MIQSRGLNASSPRKGRAYSVPVMSEGGFGVAPLLELAESPFVYNVVATCVVE